MPIRAIHRNFGMSPSKVRRLLHLIKGKPVNDAIAAIQVSPSPAAKALVKVIKSAVANAENNAMMNPDSLKIVEAFANEALKLKRYRPQSRGRISPIIRRSCHITIGVDEEVSNGS
ncbi:MAG: 50S ribosomal protein L22 [Chloroflexi bacterium]|nr:50S ribosomal protein L22 [Chloroflexota bacterium]